jgi:hypothetical protein
MDINLSTRNLLERRKAANVVGMSVGHDNMADISWLLSQRVQGPQDGTHTARNSSVNQSATIRRIQEIDIDRAHRNDIEPLRDLCNLYCAHEDNPAEETRKLLPPSLFARLCKKGSSSNGRFEPKKATIENAGIKKVCDQTPQARQKTISRLAYDLSTPRHRSLLQPWRTRRLTVWSHRYADRTKRTIKNTFDRAQV